jgi:cellobiose dehydrogenase-like cytochrome
MAIGIGHTMRGALMFIFYADSNRERLTLSPRTATGYVMPKLLGEDAPEIEVLRAGFTDSGQTLSAKVACYACDQWPALDINSALQPWIYAGNTDQVFHGADVDAHLSFHDVVGHFTIDMSSTLLGDEELTSFIDSERPSDSEGHDQDTKKHKKWPSPAQIHGLIMACCFMGIFAFGAIVIQFPLSRNFQLHWIAQLTASLLSISSAAYMLSRARHLGTHQIIGLIVTSLLIPQGYLGYKHHKIFVKSRRPSLFTNLHLWLGRGILCLGTVNIGTGMYIAGFSALGLSIWFVAAISELAFYIYVNRTHKKRKQAPGGYKVTSRTNDDQDEYFDETEGVALMEREE